MFGKLRQKMKRHMTPRKERTDAVRVRGALERLEERTMLSASYGSTGHAHGGSQLAPRGGPSSQFGDSAAVASHQQRSVSYDTQTFSNGREVGGSYSESQSRSAMQSAFQPSRPQPFEQHGYQQPMLTQSAANFPPPMLGYSQLEYFDVSPEPTYTAYYFVNVPQKVQKTQKSELGSANGYVSQGTSALPPDLGFGNFDRTSVPNGLPDHFQLPGGVTIEPLRYTNPSGIQGAAKGYPRADVPFASQILARETGTVAALTAVAREVAFQEFSATLFQANATSPADRANFDLVGAETTQSDMLDGFIPPADGSNVTDTVNTSHAVARERKAVDAVLEELHDLDKLLPDGASTDVNFPIDLQAESSLDELPAGEVDGGMVLLQSTRDANESGFDLTPVYADHLERFDAPAKMEMTIGMFQAVDVAIDEAPIIEAPPTTDSSTELKPEIKLDDTLPRKRQSSSNKAAAIVGATTLTGALVWLNRAGSRISRQKSTAQKRRAFRE
jgi:hypothetical protein